MKLISLFVMLTVSACNCGEPLYVVPEEEAVAPLPPVDFDEPEDYVLDETATANVEREPVVMNTCNGNAVTIAPQAPPSVWGEFQSTPGTGAQQPIQIVFTCPVQSVSITIWDPDFPGNEMIAFDTANEVGRVTFLGDNTPNVLTTDTETLNASAISRVSLIPDPADFVAYGELLYTM
jgi:hypothetical protein